MRKTKRGKIRINYILFSIILLLCLWIYYDIKTEQSILTEYTDGLNALSRTEKNYSEELDKLAQDFDLDASYLKALVALECSGRKFFNPRFEAHVYNELIKVRDGDQKNYGSIKRETLKDASNEALKNLATSWGPFQLMGYQCIRLGVNVADIRGEKALYWGVFWINKRYGKYLRKGKFKDAFHIHNTGGPHPLIGGPRTHDPNYVSNGLAYMEYFKNK